MPIFELLIPEVKEALMRRYDRRLFIRGQAAGYLMKAAAEKEGGSPTPISALSGRLYLSPSGWLLLSVPAALVRGVFSAMHLPGLELPPSGPDGQLRAHISVMDADEVRKIGPDRITERGKHYSYGINRMKEVEPAGWPEMSRVYFLEITAPGLEQLRKTYGLTPRLKGHAFHISVACRRRNILKNNNISKVTSPPDDEIKDAV